MSSEVERISQLLERTYQGDAWHGPSVQTVLSDLSSTQALHRIGDSHNAVEIVRHMTAWRNFVIQRLAGNDTYELTEAANWSTVSSLSEAEWQHTLDELDRSQRGLLAALHQQKEEQLTKLVAHRSYSYYVLLHGIIQHDTYHLGQVRLLGHHA